MGGICRLRNKGYIFVGMEVKTDGEEWYSNVVFLVRSKILAAVLIDE